MQRNDVMRSFSGVAEAMATSAVQLIVESDPRQLDAPPGNDAKNESFSGDCGSPVICCVREYGEHVSAAH